MLTIRTVEALLVDHPCCVEVVIDIQIEVEVKVEVVVDLQVEEEAEIEVKAIRATLYITTGDSGNSITGTF